MCLFFRCDTIPSSKHDVCFIRTREPIPDASVADAPADDDDDGPRVAMLTEQDSIPYKLYSFNGWVFVHQVIIYGKCIAQKRCHCNMYFFSLLGVSPWTW